LGSAGREGDRDAGVGWGGVEREEPGRHAGASEGERG
jgi:hypothetical protein